MIMSTRIPKLSAAAEAAAPMPATTQSVLPSSGIAPDVVVDSKENI
jgi:hypothetical protein